MPTKAHILQDPLRPLSWLMFLLLLMFGSESAQPRAASVTHFSATTCNVSEDVPRLAIAVQRTNDLDTALNADSGAATDSSRKQVTNVHRLRKSR